MIIKSRLLTILLFIAGLLSFFSAFSQKSFYLLDSLNARKLSAYDRKLLDSVLTKYHKTSSDTIQLNMLEFLVEYTENEEIWPGYNDIILKRVSGKLEQGRLNNKEDVFYKKKLAKAFNNNGYRYQQFTNKVDSAFYFYKKSYELSKSINDRQNLAEAANNLGFLYNQQGQRHLGLSYLHECLKLNEQLNNISGIAVSLINIGNIYKELGHHQQALSNFQQSLKYSLEIKDKRGLGAAMINIANIYDEQGKYEKAAIFYHKVLGIYRETSNRFGEASCLKSMADMYARRGKTAKAISLYEKAIKIEKDIGNSTYLCATYISLGQLMYNIGNSDLAYKYAYLSLDLATEVGFPDEIKKSALLLSQIYEDRGEIPKAYEMYKLFANMKDSILNIENQKHAADLEMERKESQIEMLNKDKELKEKKIEQQKFTRNLLIGFLVLIAIFAIFVFKNYREKHKTATLLSFQKGQIEQKNAALTEQGIKLHEKNQQISDSINYARHIQSGIISDENNFKDYFADAFALFKPKDIVSGDFYWMKESAHKFYFSVVDCTGHGVPGAFMTIFGYSILEQTVKSEVALTPSEVLGRVSRRLYKRIRRKDDSVLDGMEMIVATYDKETKVLEYASSFQSFFLIRNNEIKKFDGDVLIVGKTGDERFSDYSLQLQEGDRIYFFTDGYADQKGGPNNKKFMISQLKKLLLFIHQQDMATQKNELDTTIEIWKHTNEQTDDITVLGFKV